jgi:hypothetical protein
MSVFSEVEEEHREHEHQHHQQERAEYRVSETALEQIPEPDHEGRELIRFPCKKKQLVIRHPPICGRGKAVATGEGVPAARRRSEASLGIRGQAGAQPE